MLICIDGDVGRLIRVSKARMRSRSADRYSLFSFKYHTRLSNIRHALFFVADGHFLSLVSYRSFFVFLNIFFLHCLEHDEYRRRSVK